ncbi:prepilin peptidase [bacterium]|nr:prepilin peptidase [bacterium]
MDPFTNNYILFWVCIFGLCFGSFFNVVILRSLSNESIVFPASKCPKCNNKLKPWHNIPVVSYLFLRGKCAFCKEKISIQYPLIELVTMLLFAFCYIKFGLTWNCLFGVILSSCLLIMTMTDLKEKLVDCNIAIGLGVVGLIYNYFVNSAFLDSVYGLLAGVVIMELLARIGYLISKGRAFGEADTYVAGALGACFGLVGLIQVLFYTLLASMVFVIPMFLYRQLRKGNRAICILFILFILSALFYKTVLQNWYSFGLLVGLGFMLSLLVLKNLKTEHEPLYLPLVPSFTLGALYFLFF